MKAGHRRIIGFILTLFICVAGMYFGDVKVDSVFVCPSVDVSGACIETVDSVADNSKACTSEMLGIRRNVTLRDNYVRTSGRREYRITVDFYQDNGNGYNVRPFYAGISDGRDYNVRQEELVTNYIHKSDGKKRV